MFEPMAMPPAPRRAASSDTSSSGVEVPKLSTVSPSTRGGIVEPERRGARALNEPVAAEIEPGRAACEEKSCHDSIR